jgi:hypothetical protein
MAPSPSIRRSTRPEHCLAKSRAPLLAFLCDVAAEHRTHIPPSNMTERTFATVHLRTDVTRLCGAAGL